MSNSSLVDRLKKPGPKRILALDGGGIRGALSLGFLGEIEKLLRRRHGNRDLRLCDYFDLIGGTSTGAIIAAGLASGMTALELKDYYLKIGGKIFGSKNNFIKEFLRGAKFDHRPLEGALREVFGETELGSDALHTGLCIVFI